MMRVFTLILALCLLPTATGCQPEVSRDELGTVLEEVPVVTGSEEPYELPELDVRDTNKQKESTQ